MKRQKGVMRKEVRTDVPQINFQSEISKVFGTETQPDEKIDESQPRMSLIAEIFGSDEEELEEENAEVNKTTAQPPIVNSQSSNLVENLEINVVDPDQTAKPLESVIDVNSGRWKTILDEPTVDESISAETATSQSTTTPIEMNTSNEEDVPDKVTDLSQSQDQVSEEELEIIEIVSLNSAPRLPQQTRNVLGPHDIETVSVSEDSDVEVISEVHGARKTKGKTRSKRTDDGIDASRSHSRSPQKRRERKRRHSSSSASFFEEGEIVDQGDDAGKRRRREKKRKLKKRRLTKDKDGSGGAKKRKSEGAAKDMQTTVSSDEDLKSGADAVSWKRPSKMSADRRYRSSDERSHHTLDHKKGKNENKSSDVHRSRESKSPSRLRGSPRRSSNRAGKSRSHSGSSEVSHNSFRSASRYRRHRSSGSSRRHGHSRSPSRSPEAIRPRSSHVSRKKISRSQSGGRDRSDHRKSKQPSESPSRSPISGFKRKSKYTQAEEIIRRKRLKVRKIERAALKAKRKAKERLKVKDKRKSDQKDEQNVSEPVKPHKEKGEKKRKKREKSLSPVKAIVADGDSIVVSLSFHKETFPHGKQDDKHLSGKDGRERKSVRKRSAASASKENDKTKSPSLPKNLDLGAEDLSSTSESSTNVGTRSRDNETGASKVSSSGDGAPRVSGRLDSERSFGSIVTDNSKAGKKQDETKEVQEDSLVTSTRDSLEPSAVNEDDYTTAATSPANPKPSSDGSKPAAQSVSSSAISPRIQGGNVGGSALASSHFSQSQTSIGTASASSGNSSGQKSSSFSIGQNLFTTSAVTQTAMPATMSQSQAIRYSVSASTSTSILNPVLATMASALFAVRPTAANTLGGMLGDQLRNRSVFSSMTKKSHSRPQGKKSATGGGDSPVSPNSSDGDELFEPPSDNGPNRKGSKHRNGGMPPSNNSMSNIFDSLFGSEPPRQAPKQEASKPSRSKGQGQMRPHQRKGQKPESSATSSFHGQPIKASDINFNEDVPSSAVELSVQEKLLKKLNRQERVVEEVKLCLKPHYIKKHINKEDYKEILRRAVPKVCHSKTGEINPMKVREMIEAYVKKFRHSRNKAP